mmetsp:Transcript_155192/g.497694  ORF Transcript_155192/g.497694 Transcript_155192/m.497694 type:complete len:211 (+) Transcript_155192:295-927(+)
MTTGPPAPTFWTRELSLLICWRPSCGCGAKRRFLPACFVLGDPHSLCPPSCAARVCWKALFCYRRPWDVRSATQFWLSVRATCLYRARSPLPTRPRLASIFSRVLPTQRPAFCRATLPRCVALRRWPRPVEGEQRQLRQTEGPSASCSVTSPARWRGWIRRRCGGPRRLHARRRALPAGPRCLRRRRRQRPTRRLIRVAASTPSSASAAR